MKVTSTTRMQELLLQAEHSGMWLVDRTTGQWFSPDELRQAQAVMDKIRPMDEGGYSYLADCWELRSPNLELLRLMDESHKALMSVTDFIKRIEVWEMKRSIGDAGSNQDKDENLYLKFKERQKGENDESGS